MSEQSSDDSLEPESPKRLKLTSPTNDTKNEKITSRNFLGRAMTEPGISELLTAAKSRDNHDRPCLRSFTEPDPLSNVILEVEGVELHVHKEVLASLSPVFMAMFTNNFLEAQQNKVAMPGKTVGDVQLFLNCLYSTKAVTINKSNVMTLLPLIDEYRVTSLLPECGKAIRSFDHGLDLVAAVCAYNLDEVKCDAIEGCSKLPLKSIDHHTQPMAKHIPESVMLDIYRTKLQAEIQDVIRVKEQNNSYRLEKDRLEKELQSKLNDILSWEHRNSCKASSMFGDQCRNDCFQRYAEKQIRSLMNRSPMMLLKNNNG